MNDDANRFLAHNIKGLMMDLIVAWDLRIADARAESEFAELSAGDLKVMGLLRGRPTPLSSIHRGMGVSRQASHKVVKNLATHGLVELKPMEGSQRDKVVVVTAKGQRWRALVAEQISGIERDCAERLGEDQLETLRELLLALHADPLGSTADPRGST